MAGLVEGFDPADFRAAIQQTMTMGLAPIEADQPTFCFKQDPINFSNADVEDVPFDPAARPVQPPPETKQVPCAVEYVDAAGRVETFGVINPSKVRLTLLDVDYQTIRGFDFVEIGGDKYNYAKTEPPIGLGEVGVWTVHCIAEDET